MADRMIKDYEGFRAFMLERASVLCPEWTDKSRTDFGVVLVELFAECLDIVMYYQDRNHEETSLATAQIKSRVIQMAQALGYETGDQIPSKFLQVFSKHEDDLLSDMLVPRGTLLYTKDPVIQFELESDVVVPSGQLSGTGTIVQGLTVMDDVGVSNGTANQKFTLKYPDILLSSLRLFVKDIAGIETEYVKVSKKNKYDYNDKSKIFFVEVDGDNFATVIFGNGTNGMIPPQNSSIRFVGRQVDGVAGNVGLNTITEWFGSVPLLFTTTNSTEAVQLGQNVEDIDSIRDNAPIAKKATTLVTKEDWHYVANQHVLTGRVKVEETFNANNDLDIYVCNNSFGTMSAPDKATLLTYLNAQPRLPNVVPVIKDLTIADTPITITATVSETTSRAIKKAEIEEAIRKSFGPEVIPVGSTITSQEIFAVAFGCVELSNIVVDAINVPASPFKLVNITTITITLTGGVA